MYINSRDCNYSILSVFYILGYPSGTSNWNIHTNTGRIDKEDEKSTTIKSPGLLSV